MINLYSFRPPVSTPKGARYAKTPRSAAVSGSEINQLPPKVMTEEERRRQKDRRKRSIKPLIDLRSGQDRRDLNDRLKVDIEV